MQNSKNQIKKIITRICLPMAILAVVLSSVNPAPALAMTSNYQATPASCPHSDQLFSTPCPGGATRKICGNSGSTPLAPLCWDFTSFPATPPATSTTSSTVLSAVGAGYIVDCFNTTSSGSPFCTNNGNYICNADPACTNTNHEVTQCNSGYFAASGSSAFTCTSTCISGWYDCGSGNCDTQNGGTCGTGTWSIGGAGNACSTTAGGTKTLARACIAASNTNFQAGVQNNYSTNNTLLWGTQQGGGPIINFGNNTTPNLLTMLNSGYVGIGVATPTENLDVNGTLGVTNASGSATIFQTGLGQTGNLTYTLPIIGGSAGQVLTNNGSGTLSWTTAGGTGTVTSVAATSSVGLTFSGSPITTTGTLSLDGGTLAVANGGTGIGSGTQGGIMYFSGPTAISFSNAGLTSQILMSAGTGTPTWSSATYPATTTAGQILYSTATNTIGGSPNLTFDGTTLSAGGFYTAGTGSFGYLTVGTGSSTFTFPASAGTPGQVLTNNGSGSTYWATATTGITGTGTATYIPEFTSGNVIGNSPIFDNAGNIGIGTTTASYSLDIVKSATPTASPVDVAAFEVSPNGSRVGGFGPRILFKDPGPPNVLANTMAGVGALYQSDAANADLVFYTNNNTSSTLTEAMRITGGTSADGSFGNVGIGTATPAYKLDIAGNINVASGSSYLYDGVSVIRAQIASNNYFLGNSGNFTTTGNSNTGNGSFSLSNNGAGYSNTANGGWALYSNTSGNNNTAIGADAGLSNSTGSSNVFLGFKAGYYETGDNKLYISNSNTKWPLIYGDFSGTGALTVNGTLAIGDGAGDTYYTLPRAAGSAGQVLANDGSGTLTWTSTVLGSGSQNFNTYWSTANTLGAEQYVALSRGGTNNTLTASNGGIVYSDASRLNVLPGTPTADLILMSGSSSAPSWSSATYPATTTAGQILYSTATNTIGGSPNLTFDGTTLSAGGFYTAGTGSFGYLTVGTGSSTFTFPASAGTPGQVLTNNGSGSTSWTALNLSSATGTLGVANGGTGLATGTQGGVLYFSGPTTLASTASGTSGQFLTSNGTSTPTWTNISGYANTTLSNLATPTAINQDLLPGSDNNYSLGSSTLRWKDLYVEGSSIHIGTSGNEANLTYDTASSTLGIDKNVRVSASNTLSLGDTTGMASNAGALMIGTVPQAYNLAIADSSDANILLQGTSPTSSAFIRFRNDSGVNVASIGYYNPGSATASNSVFVNRKDSTVPIIFSTLMAPFATFASGTGHLLLNTSTDTSNWLNVNGAASIQGQLALGSGASAYYMPTSAGTTGQVLTATDSSGTLTWATPSAGNSSTGTNSFQISNGSGGFYGMGLYASSTRNLFIGDAGYSITGGTSNIFLGDYSGGQDSAGSQNIFIGMNAGSSNQTGNDNTFLGFGAGASAQGDTNVLLGNQAGQVVSGNGNIFIGYKAGVNQGSTSDSLIIDNRLRANGPAELTNSLIYGTFGATPASQTLTINGKLQIGNSAGTAVAYAFPQADGALNQVLTTNGSGTTSWTALNLSSATGTLGVVNGGTGLSSVATGTVLAATSANTFSPITATSGTTYLTNSSGSISWGTVPGAAVFVGLTTATSTGNFGANGYKSGDAVCSGTAGVFSGSHVCSTAEILYTISTNISLIAPSSGSTAWISNGPPGYTVSANDCNGHISAGGADLGAFWSFSGDSGGAGWLTNCSVVKNLACCK